MSTSDVGASPAITKREVAATLHQGRSLLWQRRAVLADENHGAEREDAATCSPAVTSSATLPAGPSVLPRAASQRYAQAARHLRELVALDEANAAVFSRRMAALQRLVSEANAEGHGGGGGMATEPRAAQRGVGAEAARLAQKEEALARLTYTSQAIEEGEEVITKLLSAGNEKLLRESIPHIRRLMAGVLGTTAEQLPAFPSPVASIRSTASTLSSSPLGAAIRALADTTAALDRYLSHDISPLVQRCRVDYMQQMEFLTSAVEEARAVRGEWGAKLDALAATSGRRGSGLPSTESHDPASSSSPREEYVRMQDEKEWVSRARPLHERRQVLLTQCQELKAAVEDATATLRREQREAEGLVERVAAAEHEGERKRLAHEALVTAAAKQAMAASAAAQQADAQEAELVRLRHAIRERQREGEAVQAEHTRTALLLARAEAAHQAWDTHDGAELRAALTAAKEEQRLREGTLARMKEALARTRQQNSVALQEVDHLRRRKRWIEEQLVSHAP